MSTDTVRAVLRLRTMGPSGLNPPQTEIIDRLQTLSEDGPITDLDVDVWGASIGITQTDDRNPVHIREMVAEFEEWASERECTLRPAFEWRSAEPGDEGKRRGRIVTPLITLAVYTGEELQAVYPHVDGDELDTVHDGVESLASMAETEDAEQPEDEQSEKRAALAQ